MLFSTSSEKITFGSVSGAYVVVSAESVVIGAEASVSAELLFLPPHEERRIAQSIDRTMPRLSVCVMAVISFISLTPYSGSVLYGYFITALPSCQSSAAP